MNAASESPIVGTNIFSLAIQLRISLLYGLLFLCPVDVRLIEFVRNILDHSLIPRVFLNSLPSLFVVHRVIPQIWLPRTGHWASPEP